MFVVGNTDISTLLITLFVNGYNFDYVDRLSTEATLVNAHTYHTFGAKIKYTFLIATNSNKSCLDSLKILSEAEGSTAIVISDTLDVDDFIKYTIKDFEKKIGGIVNSKLVFKDDLPEILNELGHNKLPKGFENDEKPEDILEDYVKQLLQYLLVSPARRFGKERLFESLPDGVILGKNKTIILFDAKSYSNGYKTSADDIKRYASYVEKFNSEYSDLFGLVHSFLIVSGSFQDSEISMKRRRNELYKLCGSSLSYLSSKELGEIVVLIKQNSDLRQSIDWKYFFSEQKLTKKMVVENIEKLKKDNII